MAVNILAELRKLCRRRRPKKKKHDRLEHENEILPSRIQTLVSQGEYDGLSPYVRAEGAFVQYNEDGTFYRRVGLGITHTELLFVTEPLPDNEDDDVEGLKINLVFPLPAVLFILLDNRSKRFAICTCVGILMFFEMCIDEPNCDENWQRWRRVIFLQTDDKLNAGFHKMEAPSWQPVWSSPYVINLSGQNDKATFEFLAEKKGHLDRTLHFIQQPFTIRLVRHIGMQTTGVVTSRPTTGQPPSRKTTGQTHTRKTTGRMATQGDNQSKHRTEESKWSTVRKESMKPGGLSKIGSPTQSLKSSAKSYLEKLEQNRAGHNKVELSDSIERGVHENKIVLSVSGAKDGSGNSEIENGDTGGDLKLKLDNKSKILVGNELWRTKAREAIKNKTETKTVRDIDLLLLQSTGRAKNRTIPEQRMSSFYGGMKCLLDAPYVSKRKYCSTPVRKACSCDNLLLTEEGARLTKAEKIVACSWNSEICSSSLTASDKILAKKYTRYTQKMKQRSNKRPLETSSPTEDIGDIDDLVIDFVERKEEAKSHRSGRELWGIAKRKVFSRRKRSHVHHLQNVVYTFLKVSTKRKSTGAKQLTDLTPLAVALELFAVSKKMLLAVSASDVLKFTCSNGILEVKPLFTIIKFGDDVTRMVTSQILDCKVLLERIDRVRFFIEVCKHLLLKCHDLQSFTSIMRALTSLPVFRLQNTWTTFYMEYPLHFSTFICFSKILSQAHGFKAYTSRIETYFKRGEPCIPWIEHFLIHCKRWSNSCIKSENRIKFSLKKTKIKKVKRKDQKKTDATKSDALVSSTEDNLKPILQQRKIFEDTTKQKKAVRFHSKVDVAEKQTGIFDTLRRAKVALGEKIVKPRHDEERENIEHFSEETATTIIDGAMQDIKGQTRGKRTHEKTLGIYLKKKTPIDDDENEGEGKHKKDEFKKLIAKMQSITKQETNLHEKETNILPSAFKEQKQKKTFHSKLADRHTPNPKTENNDNFTPLKRKETENQKAGKKQTEKRNTVSPSASSSRDITEQSRKDSSKTSVSSTEKGKESADGKRRLSIFPKPQTPTMKKDLPNEAMPSRKRRMSVMDMKKQNRRMSLFEQAEQKRDKRKDSVIDSEIQRKIQAMRRKGSIAVDLFQPDNLKSMSRNNNFQENEAHKADGHSVKARKSKRYKNYVYTKMDQEAKDNRAFNEKHHLPNTPCTNNLISWAFGDYTDIGILSVVKQANNSNTNKLPIQNEKIRGQKAKRNSGAINLCRSWSGSCLDISKSVSAKKCGLCGKKVCVYKHGLWKTFLQIQLNVLESEIHSSNIANKCLKAAIAASSKLSDNDLLQKSFNLEG